MPPRERPPRAPLIRLACKALPAQPPAPRRSPAPPPFRSATSRAFTLIELLAVLLLLGLLTAAVSLSLASSHRNAEMSDVVAQVIQYDALARAAAREHGTPLRLSFSFQNGTISRDPANPERRTGVRASSLTLPPGYSLRELRASSKRTAFGQAALPLSSLGQSPDYALLIVGTKEQRQWVLMTGLTAQPVLLNSDRDVERLFQPRTP